MPYSKNNYKKYFGKYFFIMKGVFFIIFLVSILLIITSLGEYYNIDRRFSSNFFTFENDWFLGKKFPWNWFYDFGAIPGILLSIISFFLWAFYRSRPKIGELSPYFLICGFTPIIASLIIVNVILKDHTGRPRPREITQFKGEWNYKPVFKAGIPGKGHSFPCGHCSIAFTLTSGIVFFRKSRKIAISFFSIGLIYGILMSIARLLQGGHFLSDAIWSLGVVLLTIISLYYFIFQPPKKENNQILLLSKKQKYKIISYSTIALTILIFFVFTRRPFFKNHFKNFTINNSIRYLEIDIPEHWSISPIYLNEVKEGKFILEIRGYAPPFTTHYLNFGSKINLDTMKLLFRENIVGYKRDFNYNLMLKLPTKFNGNLKVIKQKKN